MCPFGGGLLSDATVCGSYNMYLPLRRHASSPTPECLGYWRSIHTCGSLMSDSDRSQPCSSSAHPMRVAPGRRGCYTTRTPTSFMMSNAIGLILLICTLLLCCIARHPLCRPDCFVNKHISCNTIPVHVLILGSQKTKVRI